MIEEKGVQRKAAIFVSVMFLLLEKKLSKNADA